MRDEAIASRESGPAEAGRRKARRAWSVPAVFAAFYLGSGAAVAAVEAGVRDAGRFEATVVAAVFPLAYLGLFVALQRYWPVFWLRRGYTSLMAAHAVTFASTPFVILYVASQVWRLPLLITILPMAFVALGWLAVLPLTIYAFARSRSWLDLVPLLGYAVSVGVSFPVMLHIT